MKLIPLSAFLLVFILQINAQVTLRMAQVIGSTDYDVLSDMEVDGDGNIYTVGGYYNTVDFNAGPGVNALTSLGLTDAFILKTDSVGNFQWVISFGGTGTEKCSGIGFDNDNNIYVGGEFSSTVDFDPGPGVFNMTGIGGNAFIVKLNALGEFVWAKQMDAKLYALDVSPDGILVNSGGYDGSVDFDPGPGVYNIGSVDYNPYVQVLDADGNFLMAMGFGTVGIAQSASCLIDVNNNIWVTGAFYGTFDFDPGPGVFNLTDVGLADNFIAKYSIDGSFLWAGRFGAALAQEGNIWGLADDETGNIYLGGAFYQTVDFDMGPGVVNKTATSFTNGYMLKINNNGEFIWVKTIGGTNQTEYLGIDVDDEQNVYAGGSFSFVTDLDPGLGVHNVYAHGEIGADDCFIHKLDADGNFVWAAAFGGDEFDNLRSICVLPDNQVLFAGTVAGPVDMDPGGNIFNVDGYGASDIFIEKLKPTACADLTLIIDSVSNASCLDEGFALCHAISGIAPYDYVWETDPYIFDSVATFSEGGFYNVFVTDGMSCVKGTSVLVTGPATTTEIDMAGVLVNVGFAPGFTTYLWPEVYNNGCSPATGNYQVILDPLLEYTGSTIPPDIISGDTLTWFFENITYDSIIPTPQISVLTPDVVEIGWKLNLELIINADGDYDVLNNYLNYNIVVEGAFDPNDKQVTPQGACDAGYVTHDQVLTYTVRFQNTGTAPAVNIVIDDTLSNRINVNSLRVVAASHPMHTEFEGLNIAKFVFNDIYLPDSTTNEPESHGYVVFEVKTKPSAPDYAIVENNAAIYFDFNEPVITNSVINTLVDEIPIFNYAQDITICESDSFMVGEHVYYNSGIYFDLLSGATGCDSAITTTLHVVPNFTLAVDTTICSGESLIIGGNTFNTAGDFLIDLTTAAGCDSIINLHLDVNPVYENLIEATMCADETYSFNGELLSLPGLYTLGLLSEGGCDSIITLNLQVNPTFDTLMEASICPDETYLFNGELLSLDGTYTASLTSASGCDSVVTLTLHVNPMYDTIIDATICQDEYFLFNGELLSLAGTYNAGLTSEEGCDSLVTLNLSVTTINTDVMPDETVLTAMQTDASYQWINCNHGNSWVVGATAQSFVPTTTGNYAVIIQYLECTDTSDCYTAGPVNTADLINYPVVQIYPNPVIHTLHCIVPPQLINCELLVYDIFGNLVMALPPGASQDDIFVGTLSSGIYLIRLQDEFNHGIGSFIKE